MFQKTNRLPYLVTSLVAMVTSLTLFNLYQKKILISLSDIIFAKYECLRTSFPDASFNYLPNTVNMTPYFFLYGALTLQIMLLNLSWRQSILRVFSVLAFPLVMVFITIALIISHATSLTPSKDENCHSWMQEKMTTCSRISSIMSFVIICIVIIKTISDICSHLIKVDPIDAWNASKRKIGLSLTIVVIGFFSIMLFFDTKTTIVKSFAQNFLPDSKCIQMIFQQKAIKYYIGEDLMQFPFMCLYLMIIIQSYKKNLSYVQCCMRVFSIMLTSVFMTLMQALPIWIKLMVGPKMSDEPKPEDPNYYEKKCRVWYLNNFDHNHNNNNNNYDYDNDRFSHREGYMQCVFILMVMIVLLKIIIDFFEINLSNLSEMDKKQSVSEINWAPHHFMSYITPVEKETVNPVPQPQTPPRPTRRLMRRSP